MLRPTPGIAFVVLAALTLVTPLAARQSAAPTYTKVAELPSIIDGTGVRSLKYDATRNRLYAAVQTGLFWIDLSEKKPRVKGPFVRKNIVKIEFAPEVEKIFYMTADEVGYADLERFGESKTLKTNLTPIDIVYEPTHKELYVATRDKHLMVFDGASGRAGDDVPLQGWFAVELEAIPGRVFVELADKQGLYTIDAATHQMAPWPVTGRLFTPAYLEADPAGEYLFATFYREFVAIDVKRAAVVGNIVTPSVPAIAFDPGERLLIVTWGDDDPPPFKVRTYRPTADGLAEVDRLENPRVGVSGVEPTSHGFVQSGHLALLIWSSRPGQMFQLTTPNRQK
ncbi:MAG TPA: hypothetical protein VJN96_17810 [Vicinamibacterales bacterium]|nr:hypothetical protein [Vicinamibacterales bacterium]